jgi:hypothetical protein
MRVLTVFSVATPYEALYQGKQHGTIRKTKHLGLAGVAADFLFNRIGYNLVRIHKLLAQRGIEVSDNTNCP